MKKLVTFFALAILSLPILAATNTTTQDTGTPANSYHGGWLNVGFGGGYGPSLGGPAGEISLNYAPSDSRLWTARATMVANFGGMFADAICNAVLDAGTTSYTHCIDERSVGDYGVLYGLMKKGDNGYVSGSAGLAVVDLISPDIYVNDTKVESGSNSYTVGLPLELQAFWTPTKYVGLGVIGLGDINGQKSYAAALVALQFGLLK